MARKRKHLMVEQNAMKKEKGSNELILHEQSVLKLCNLYFMQFVYRHKTENIIKYTLKEMGQNITIIKLK